MNEQIEEFSHWNLEDLNNAYERCVDNGWHDLAQRFKKSIDSRHED